MLSCDQSVVSDSLQPRGLLCPWDFPGKNTGVCCHFLFQGIFQTQGSNLGLPHCRWILYYLSLQGSPARFLCPWNSLGKNSGEGDHSLLQGILTTQESNLSLPHCRQIFLPTEPPGTSHPPPPQKNPLKNQMQNTRLCVLSHNLFLFHS